MKFSGLIACGMARTDLLLRVILIILRILDVDNREFWIQMGKNPKFWVCVWCRFDDTGSVLFGF